MQSPSNSSFKEKKPENGLDGPAFDIKSLSKIPANKLHMTKLSQVLKKVASVDPSRYIIQEDTITVIQPEFLVSHAKRLWVQASKVCRAQNWKSVQHLNLTFWKVTNPGLSVWISKLLKPFANLKQLSLAFVGCSGITATELEIIGFRLSKFLIGLEDLTIDVSDCAGFQEKYFHLSILQFSQNLTKLKRFKLISLNIQHAKGIDEESLPKIAATIGRRLSRLEKLELCLGKSRIGSEDLKITDDGLKPLESLVLRKQTQIGDKGLKSLMTYILNKMTSLENLKISFGGNDKITAESIKSIGTELCKKGKNLRNLTMAFEHCVGIFPNDLKALRKKINKGLPQLEQFTLSTKAIDYRILSKDPKPPTV